MAQPTAKDTALPLSPSPPVPPTSAATSVPPRPIKPLVARRLRTITSSEANFGNLHAATLEAGSPFDHALDPNFWTNVTTMLRASDRIEVHSDDSCFFGLLYVRAVAGGGGAKATVSVAKILHTEFGDLPTTTSAPPLYRVEHKGPHFEWTVIRLSDGKHMVEHLATREAAETALKGVERSLDRKVA
jgi:hypothetical protein